MGAALTYFCLFNGVSTPRAGIAGLLIDLEVILKIPSSIHPVDAGTFLVNAFGEHKADRIQQPASLCQGKAVAHSLGVKPGLEESFVRIDVADACQEALVDQKRFEQPGTILEHFSEDCGGELFIKGFRT